jgi:hypothetical protein
MLSVFLILASQYFLHDALACTIQGEFGKPSVTPTVHFPDLTLRSLDSDR